MTLSYDIEGFGSVSRFRALSTDESLSFAESRLLKTDEVITIARSANLGFAGQPRAEVAWTRF